jgi:hypothetical protein
MEVTMDNIFNAVNSEHSYTGDKSSVNIIMGYRFVKDKAKDKKKGNWKTEMENSSEESSIVSVT